MALEITGDRTLCEDPYLIMKERSFLDRFGDPKKWSFVERRSNRGAVVIVPVTARSRSLIVIRQFRVPFGRPVIEFPAGLMDAGESPEQTALRELREETGYGGRVLRVGPAVSTSAGLTTELVHMVFVEADEEPDPLSDTGPESSEEISVIRVREGEIAGALEQWESQGDIIDIKLYVYFRSRAGW